MPAISRVVFNQKGGVGKTTITVNLAAEAARNGRRVVLIDLDTQANATHYLLDDAQPPHTVCDLFGEMLSARMYSKTPQDFVCQTPVEGLHLIAGDPALSELTSKLEARYKIYKLKEAVASLGNDYDEIWIDTPPALNFYTRSALIAVDRCLIPFDCDTFSRQALYDLIEETEEIRSDHNPQLTVEGIIVNQFQSRATLPQRLVAELKADGLPVLSATLSSSVKIRESHASSTPIVFGFPSHKLAQEFTSLYRELNQPG